jgi:oligopeptide transport system substrate-binding protein
MARSRRTGRPAIASFLARFDMTRFRLFAVALVAVALAAGCKRKESSSSTPHVFRFINRGNIITLDLNQMSYVQDFRVTYAFREGLYTYDPADAFKPTPALVAEEKISDDKLTWTFKLRPDGKWSNGDPVTANDFLFSWRLMLESPGEYTSLFYYIVNAHEYETAYREGKPFDVNTVGMRAIDPLTLEIKLKNPLPFLRDFLAFPPFFPRHAKSMEPFKQTDDKGRVSYSSDYIRPDKGLVGNGPFNLVEWDSGVKLVLKKSPTYWDAAHVKLNEIVQFEVTDVQAAFTQYDRGQVEWLADPAPDIAFDLKSAGRKDLHVAPAFGTAFFTVNCGETVDGKKNPLADLRVRQALAMSIDKKYVVDNITRMGETPADAYMPPGFFDGWKSVPSPSYDLEKAKALLAEAGYPGGAAMPTIAVTYNSDSPARVAMAQYLSYQWRQNLGIKIDLDANDLKTYRNKITEKRYFIGLAAWYGDYLDASTFTDKYRRDSQNNDSNWGPQAYEDLLNAAEKEPDEAKRQDMLVKAEGMINTELPIIPVYNYVNFSLYRDNVVGTLTNPRNLVVWKELDVR